MKTATKLGVAAVLAAGIAATAILWRELRTTSPSPVQIPVGRTITEPQLVSTEFGGALLLAPDGAVWGWGIDFGTLPQSPAGLDPTLPRQLLVGTNWIRVALTYWSAYGLQADGTVWGWTWSRYSGANGMPRLTNAATPFLPGSNWVHLTAGASHCLALRKDGALFAWGQNNAGQVGEASTSASGGLENAALPVQVGTNLDWVAAAAGMFTSIAVRSDGSLWNWGIIDFDPSKRTFVEVSRPVRVGAASDWMEVVSGGYSQVARKRDGTYWVWGVNSPLYGATNRLVPTKLVLEPGDELLSITDGLIVRRLDGTTHHLSPTGRDSRLKRGAPAFDEVWSTGSMGDPGYFGLASNGTLWTWGRKLGAYRSHRLRDAVQELLFKASGRRPPSGASPPVIIHQPWPIARFQTNAVSIP